MERNDLHTTGLGLLATVGLALGVHGGLLASMASGDDTIGSWHVIDEDEEESFKAHGELVFNKTPPLGVGFNLGAAPDLVWAIPGVNWEFDIWYVVDGWGIIPGGQDGAIGAKIGIRGKHIATPHAGETSLTLDAKVGDDGTIAFNTGNGLKVTGTKAHGDHLDTYKVDASAFARDVDPAVPGQRRGLGAEAAGLSNFKLEADHTRKDGEPVGDDAASGSSVAQGTTAIFDPDDRTLTLVVGAIDILDAQGGASGTVAAEYADDPLVGQLVGEVAMRYEGFDPDRGVHVFAGGKFSLAGPDGSVVKIGGEVGEMCLTTTSAGVGEPLGNYAYFDRLSVVDTVQPDEWRSTWADRFVDQGWFGEGLPPAEAAGYLFPVLTFTTEDEDLVRATEGFRRRAELPATVLLTIAIDPDAAAPCYADLDGDGVLTIFDFLEFQNLFVSGDARADCDGSGSLTIFDFLCFQNAFVAGCGG